jgi:hypothetical protein
MMAVHTYPAQRRRARRAAVFATITALMTGLVGAVPVMAAGSGAVDATVTVARAAACLELSTSAVSFGTLALGAENQPGTPQIVVTNCGDGDETLLASGTDATGATTTWALVDSTETCADTLGTNNYHLGLSNVAGAPIASLSTSGKELGVLGAAESATHVPRISTACPGSSGGGTTLGMQVNYLVTNLDVPPPPPVTLEPIPLDQQTADTIANLLFGGTRDIIVPVDCAGDTTTNCPGGVPADPPAALHVIGSSVVATFVNGASRYDTSAHLAITTPQPIPIGTSFVGDCELTIDTAAGSIPDVQVFVQMQWVIYGDAESPNMVQLSNLTINGLESADISLGGSIGCQIADLGISFFLGTLTDTLASELGGAVCGDPESDGYVDCATLLGG